MGTKKPRVVTETSTRKWDHKEPLLAYPSEVGAVRGEVRLRFLEKQCELDVLLPLNKSEIGWTLSVQRADAAGSHERVAKSFSIEGSRYFLPLTKGVGAVETAAEAVADVVAVLSEPLVEFGLQTEKSHEYFLSKGGEASGKLVLARGVEETGTVFDRVPWLATFIDTKFIPNAVLKGAEMPPDGVSALPKSLEKVIPFEFRYWERLGDEARKCRDALVASDFFKSTSLAVVDGEILPVETTYKLLEVAVVGETMVDWPLYKAASLLRKGEGLLEVFTVSDAALAKVTGEGLVAYVDAGSSDDGVYKAIAKMLDGYDGEYVVTAVDSSSVRDALKSLGRPFQFRPGAGVGTDAIKRVFVASFGVRGDDIAWIDKYGDDFASDGEGVPFAGPPAKKKPELREYTTPSDGDADLGKTAQFNNPDPGGAGDIKEKVERDPVAAVLSVYDKALAEKADFTTGEIPKLQPAVGFDVAGNPKVRERDEERARSEKSYELHPRKLTIAKAEKGDEEEHYVLGIVLEPDVVDAQKDTYSADEVRNAAHIYMAQFQNRGLMHKDIVNGKVDLLESYLAPCDFAVGDQQVKAGTWIMAVRVKDDALWEQCKAGGLTGFSIGGSANRQPDAKANSKFLARKSGAEKKIAFQGIPIHVDRPKGTTQKGVDANGNEWTREYKVDYGFIPRTKGGDGDGLDVFVGPNSDSHKVYWVTQKNDDGDFDEYKLFMGYDSPESAQKAYEDHIPKRFFGSMHEGTVHQIKALLNQEPKETMAKALQEMALEA